MKADKSASATFTTKLLAIGNNTGIEIPAEILDHLGAGKRPSVHVDLSGYKDQNPVGVRGGKFLLGVSAAIRAATGLKGRDLVTVAEEPRPVELPAEVFKALKTEQAAIDFFKTLSNSLQRYHIDSINGAKSPETRERRIDKSVTFFLEGEQR